MVNLQLVLCVGALIGWAITALVRNPPNHLVVSNVFAGGIGSFTGALIAQGGTLYATLGITSWAGAIGGALIAIGLALGATKWRQS